MRNRSVVAAVFALALSCGGGRPRPPEPPRNIHVKTMLDAFSLRNGARVLVVRDPATDMVQLATRYDVGAIDDPDGKNGIAHVAEHLAFMLKDGDRTLDSYLAEVALYANAFTFLDYTQFESSARDDQLETLLRVEAGRLQPGLCMAIPDDLFEREREVVLNELRYRHDKADWIGLFASEAYPSDHPYHRRVGGTEETVSSITKADACAFLDRYYVPAHVTMIITGNVDKATVEAALAKTLVPVPGRAPVHRKHPARVPVVKGVRTRKRAVSQPYLVAMWSLPPALTEGDAAVRMGMANLRYEAGKALREKKLGDVELVTREGGEFAPVGVLIASLEKEDNARAAMKVIVEVATKVGDTLDDRYFENLKIRTLADAVISFDSLRARADRFADYLELADGEQGYFVQELDRIHSLEQDRVKMISETVFDPSQAGWIIVSPSDTDGEYQPVPTRFSGITHDDDGRAVPVDPAEADQPLAVELSKQRLDTARTFTLDNGLRVALLPSSWVPTVDIRLVFDSGSAAEPDGQAGISWIAANMLDWDPRDGLDRSHIIRFIRSGGDIDADVDLDTTTFRVVGLESYVDLLLTGLALYVRHGRYDGTVIEAIKKGFTEYLDEADKKHGRALLQATNRALYGVLHPYAKFGFANAASVAKMSGSTASDFRHRHYVASNGALIVTGKFDPDLVEKYVRYLFDDWPAGAVTPPDLSRVYPSPQKVGVASDPQPTVSISIAYPVPAGLDRDARARAAWSVLARMLSARVGAVREKLAASYGMTAELSINQGPSSLVITGEVDRRRAGEALAATLEAIASLRAGDDFAVDFAVARRTYAAQLSVTTNSAASTANQLSFALRNHLAPSYLGSLVKEASRLTQADVIGLLDAIAPAHQSVILYGPEADLRKAFAGAGITGARITKRAAD